MSQNSPAAQPELIRGVGLAGATTLNMIDMIGVGPFITLPLIVSAAGGPQAMLGWILGAVFALCDGLVWAELGAAMPGAGGSYRYLKEIYGPESLGRLLSFLFIWQLSFSAPFRLPRAASGWRTMRDIFGRGLTTRSWRTPCILACRCSARWRCSVFVMPANVRRDGDLRAGGVSALPANHCCRKDGGAAMGRRSAGDGLDHRCRFDALQRGAGV